jgi:hypothetical protein
MGELQDEMRKVALEHTKGMSPEEITNYADHVLAIAKEWVQKEVEQAEAALCRAHRLRDYAEAIGK